MCKFNQQSAELVASSPGLEEPLGPGMPNLSDMTSLLRDFTEAHKPSFYGIIKGKMFLGGGAETVLAGEPIVCLVSLRYRPPGPEGQNPVLAFAYTAAALLPLERLRAQRPRIAEAWDASAPSRVRALQVGNREFVDALMVVFVPHEGPVRAVTYPQYRSFGTLRPADPAPEAVQAKIDLNAKLVELGAVVRDHPPRRGAGENPTLGYMERAKDEWWRALVVDWEEGREWHATTSVPARVKFLQKRLAAAQRSSS